MRIDRTGPPALPHDVRSRATIGFPGVAPASGTVDHGRVPSPLEKPDMLLRPLIGIVLLGAGALPLAAQSFVNWETPHVSPLTLTPNGRWLLAVNTPDGRLEVFDLSSGSPVLADSIPVGLDPVSVRVDPDRPRQAWVVNHVSDDVSIVDLTTRNVVATLSTDDEPTDVVFAGRQRRAFVSCSQANTVLVFETGDVAAAPIRLAIAGEEPRAMTVKADGSEVYLAVFESGNASTVLGGGSTMGGGFPPNVVSDPAGPHGGANPPPNAGLAFNPPIAAAGPPAVGLIVKKDGAGNWMDDNGGDWTPLVSGGNAALSGRPIGWDLPDRDVAVINANSLAVGYARGLMNICMAMGVDPSTGDVTVVGTDGTNEIRFEPVLQGTFLRVHLARFDPADPANTLSVVDLNPHLTYAVSTVPQAQRDLSIGDPRGIVWNAAGTRGWVTGMGSNNVIVIDAAGARATGTPIEVGEGPTGIVHDSARQQLYVLDKFESAISVVDTQTDVETARVPFFDPTPTAIRTGRKHLYDTHKNSGLGQIACGSCHVDSRMDRLSWDLGDPSGAVKSTAGQNLGAGVLPGGAFQDWHPMKGPMTTQTLQDIIGKEPHHWRGDRDGLEEFSGAFMGLQGDDTTLTAGEMQEYEDFLATITFAPNPFRNLDNSLPTNLPLPGHFTTGRFGSAGLPLPNGDAQNGLTLFRPPNLLDGVACVTCHTLPTGVGTDFTLVPPFGPFVPLPAGPNGEAHTALVSVDGSTNVTMKTPHLRNLYEKVGMEFSQGENNAGAGFLHDGSVDSIARFVTEPVFALTSVQDVADTVAFMLAFSGGDLPAGSTSLAALEPPGPSGNHTHAAVGRRTTVSSANPPGATANLVTEMIALADANTVGLVVTGRLAAVTRGWTYVGGGVFQSDRAFDQTDRAGLEAQAGPGRELTYTVVPFGSETRIGIDRDEDGAFDRDELDLGFDPASASSVPLACSGGVPSAPTGLAARSLDDSSIELTWLHPGTDELVFVVERRGPDGHFVDIGTVPAGSTEFVDEDLPCSTRFAYRVRALNCVGQTSSTRAVAWTRPCGGGFAPPPTVPK